MRNVQTVLLLALLILAGCDGGAQLTESTQPDPDVVFTQFEEEAASVLAMVEAGGAEKGASSKHRVIRIPGGSVDQIQVAINRVGENGVVVLEEGDHLESTTLTLSKSIHLIGETGATLKVNTAPSPLPESQFEPAIYIEEASRVQVANIQLRPTEETGGTGIMILRSSRVIIRRNDIRDHQFAVVQGSGDQVLIAENNVVASSAWRTGSLGLVHGIVVTNSETTRVYRNTVSNALIGVFVSGLSGKLMANTSSNSFIGFFLCKMPMAFGKAPDGTSLGSIIPATDWLATENKSHDNLNIGFLVIDGATKNKLTGNRAWNNGLYDYELAGESVRFGFFTESSVRNKLEAGPSEGVKDCGIDNTVRGGTMVDITVDPCF